MKHKNMISVGRVIKSMEKGTPLGYIYVNIDERTLARLYHNEQNPESATLVINRYGRIISANETTRVNQPVPEESLTNWVKSVSQGTRTQRIAGDRYLVSMQSLAPYDWKVVQLVTISELTYGYWKNRPAAGRVWPDQHPVGRASVYSVRPPADPAAQPA
ncbi:cache domain-containing protein [Paenibacillus rhizoplanae]